MSVAISICDAGNYNKISVKTLQMQSKVLHYMYNTIGVYYEGNI